MSQLELNKRLLVALGLSSESSEIVMQHIEELRQQIDVLKAWKRESIEIERQWDCQAVGKLLYVPLGHEIRANIEPAIRRMMAERSEVEKRLNDALVELERLRGNSRDFPGAPLRESGQAPIPFPTPQKARVDRCSMPGVWWETHIGKTIDIFAHDACGYWTRDTGPMRCSQWIMPSDVTLLT